MTKNILLAEIQRNGMGLDVKKLLCEYFSKEEVQDALREIGEPTSGSKEELVEELSKNWQSHNRDKYELLDFTEEDTLQDICSHFNLDDTQADHNILKRRIKKVNLLGSGSKPKASSMVDDSRFYSKKPTATVDRSHDSFITKPKIKKEVDSENSDVHFHISTITNSKWGKIGALATIAGIVIMIILFAVG